MTDAPPDSFAATMLRALEGKDLTCAYDLFNRGNAYAELGRHDDAIAEAARVVRSGGRFAFFLNHPLLQTPDAGWIDDHMVDPPEQYWRIGPYLTEAVTVEEVELGVFIRFVHRPLSRYLNALIAAGFVLERMVEPAPPDGFVEQSPMYAAARHIPRLLYLRWRRS